jgi:hypothetical protein
MSDLPEPKKRKPTDTPELPTKPTDESLPKDVVTEYKTIRSTIYDGTKLRLNKERQKPLYVTPQDYPLVLDLALVEWRKKQVIGDLASVTDISLRNELWRSMNQLFAKELQLRDALCLTPNARAKKAKQAAEIMAQSDDDVEDRSY